MGNHTALTMGTNHIYLVPAQPLATVTSYRSVMMNGITKTAPVVKSLIAWDTMYNGTRFELTSTNGGHVGRNTFPLQDDDGNIESPADSLLRADS